LGRHAQGRQGRGARGRAGAGERAPRQERVPQGLHLDVMDALTQFFEAHREWLLLLSVLSVLMLVASVLLVPWLVIRAPRDVFVRDAPPERGPLALVLLLLRNLLGAVLFVAGLL